MLSSVFLLAAMASPLPALVQTAGTPPKRERYIQVREGERCPRSDNPDEVIVCGVENENERFRIPERFREALPEDATTGIARVTEVQNISNEGINSCSAIGPGGFTGCLSEEIRAAAAQRRREQAARDRAVDD